MNREILRFVDTIHRDRQIDKEVVFTGIEQALISAAQKKLGTSDGIEVVIDRESGEIQATVDGEPLSPEDLGRIAALSGKQVLLQKIREAERDVLFEEYKPKIGQLMTGTIQTKKPGGVLVISLGKTEGILPRSEQSPVENFAEGNRIKVVLKEVNLLPNRVQLICSRSSPDLVRRLFELEIPEVADYVVEVKAVAREAGHRTKIAVTTYDPNVDCVGACVGVKGARIRNIVDELFGEKIDIVRWNDSIEILILEALRPAEVASLELDFEARTATVFVRPDQQSLAIGRRGQNVRLASKLTDWDLNITPVSEEELEKMRQEEIEGRAQSLFVGEDGSPREVSAVARTPLDRLFARVETESTSRSPQSDRLAALFQKAPPADENLEADAENLEDETGQTRDDDGAGDAEFELEDLPGVGQATAQRLREAGLDTPARLLEAGSEVLAEIDGVGPSKAAKILDYLQSLE
ncbi:MAG: transcription termination factor NusA [Planctomycetota bacterium]